MALPVEPARGGYLRPFGAAVFVRDYLAGKGPDYGVEAIDPAVGAPQVDIHGAYKNALHQATAADWAVKREEIEARREGRRISPEAIEKWTAYYLGRIPYKSSRMRYHSFVVYFRLLRALRLVERTGRTERSALQDHYPQAPPRVFYRLTEAGKRAPASQFSDPVATLYGYPRGKRSPKTRQYARPPQMAPGEEGQRHSQRRAAKPRAAPAPRRDGTS